MTPSLHATLLGTIAHLAVIALAAVAPAQAQEAPAPAALEQGAPAEATGEAPLTPHERARLERFEAAERLAQQHLDTFDELDFEVFTNQQWERLHESHAHDIVVHWPDGSTTEGIERHIEDLKALFVHAPDTRILQHPVKIASGQWTSVIGLMEGTFTEPMVTADGTVIEPTGRAFALPMATISHWNEQGVMDEEYLFWDNATYMAQLGIGG